MCEQVYVGCPNCNANTEDITLYEERGVTETASLNVEGEIADYNGDSEYGDVYESYYVCNACGDRFGSLDQECTAEECECCECQPEMHVEEPEDDDKLVSLYRVNFFSSREVDADAPEEARKLNRDLCVVRLPVTAGRLAEISDEIEEYGIAYDLETTVRPHQMANALEEAA